MKSSMAFAYDRAEAAEPSVFSTVRLAWSRSVSRRNLLGPLFVFGFFGICGTLLRMRGIDTTHAYSRQTRLPVLPLPSTKVRKSHSSSTGDETGCGGPVSCRYFRLARDPGAIWELVNPG